MSKRGLGKGIGSLIQDYTFDEVIQETVSEGSILEVEISLIDQNPNQPRKNFNQDALDELADSIRAQGVLQPILVEKQDDRYLIVAGERRFRGARQAGLTTIPVIVKNFSEEHRLEVALIENLQRENLNAIEEAKAFRYLIDTSNISQDELSKRLGKKRSTIANSLRLLNLSEVMQDSLKEGLMTAGHARAILSVVNPADQEHLFRNIIEKGLSVRESENLAQQLNKGSRASKKQRIEASEKRRPAEILQLEERFLEALGTKVSIKGDLKKGKVEISYYSQEDLERIFEIVAPEVRLFDEL